MSDITQANPGSPPAHELPPERAAAAEEAIEILLDSALDPIVDMVLLARGGHYEALSHEGRVEFRRSGDGFEVLAVEGSDPLADQSTDAMSPLDAELANRYPRRGSNTYPHAFEHTAQLFDSPAAPDLCVVHSAAHNWQDQGGHRGEHGSLGIVQSRAPFVLAGRGVRAQGVVPRSTRMVDVAPTFAELLGVAPLPGGTYLQGQDGSVIEGLLDSATGRPDHLVGFLLDGTNANVLYSMAAAGEAPNVARLIEMGTAFGHGTMAALPTVTLANHTSIITGAFPGHHGILHNAWYDRAREEQVITNSPATWPWAMSNVTAGTGSIHDAIHRTWPGSFTASVNEPCDIGADYSTFGFFRDGEVPEIPETPDGLPHVTERFVRPSKDYSWSSIVDHMGVEQAIGLWEGKYRDRSYPRPRFLWVNLILTDAAMHEGGPYSEVAAAAVRDTDARLGEILAAIEGSGAFDTCAFALMADHGMEETNPQVTGDWDVPLRDAGIRFRDEGYGFIYLGV